MSDGASPRRVRAASRARWRRWLERHHATAREVERNFESLARLERDGHMHPAGLL